MPRLRILVIAGSTRTGSLNAALADLAVRRIEATGAAVRPTSLADYPVPVFDGDLLEAQGVPEGAHHLARLLGEHDGVVIVSPEYNYSMPGNLKNLIDWLSRIKPWPTIGVNGMLMSASPGAVGGHRGLISLRVPLEGLGARLHPDMFCLAHADRAFTTDGDLADEALAARFDGAIGGFLDVVEATTHYRREPAAV
ncbi:NADPH-dependent FMN reductase [Phytomonospora endophytica]|uniref:NAD(P)H-dependent FMN reductase n=1 Tax=Phytomonospora endophytica TaxID=714109 RepID=A0A841F8Z6_9ACTN|nr:NAD(P)H-dependent oxidoreductase [Phytomonospora endophytica]MBB6032224.1 NAD(P)H-dependent FMN reductase [Phytomonospora endophytica]GIG68573.1 oxidoreductase [Phytomonospora endophytica]